MVTLAPNQEFTQLASEEQLTKTVLALEANNIRTVVTQTSEEARMRVLDLIPSGVEVYNSPSRTLELIGLAEDIEHATRFQSVRTRQHSLDRVKQRDEIRRLIASPDVLVGSVHAITEQGQVMIASALGSQLAPAAAGAGAVIWVVGTQKLVRTLDEGFRRIREYSYPLEDVRTRQVYGQGSAINKILLVNGEIQPGRITIVLVKQNLGF
ncbi:MAG TPA: LUD domain-containing protein [Ktedonobacteraceae bacterium]